MKRRFKRVYIKQHYTPSKASKTVYYLNHNSWWDGLIPLYLNSYHFKQHARAIMEDEQMVKHPFFSKIGAFSINLKDSKSTIRSLRYAINSMKRSNSSLFIYPEGEITPVSSNQPTFKSGLSWLYKQMETEVDFVPIALYQQTFRDSKPELYIYIGESTKPTKNLTNQKLTNHFELALQHLLTQTRNVAGFTDEGFKPI